MKGTELNEENALQGGLNFANALMADARLICDPFIQAKIRQMITKRIEAAKIGVIRVHGNFSIVSGDPYALCQSIFGLPVTGLLRAGEAYNRYWNDQKAARVVCFRAPMTCHNNIRLLCMRDTEEMRDWYRYLTTVTILTPGTPPLTRSMAWIKIRTAAFSLITPFWWKTREKIPPSYVSSGWQKKGE